MDDLGWGEHGEMGHERLRLNQRTAVGTRDTAVSMQQLRLKILQLKNEQLQNKLHLQNLNRDQTGLRQQVVNGQARRRALEQELTNVADRVEFCETYMIMSGVPRIRERVTQVEKAVAWLEAQEATREEDYQRVITVFDQLREDMKLVQERSRQQQVVRGVVNAHGEHPHQSTRPEEVCRECLPLMLPGGNVRHMLGCSRRAIGCPQRIDQGAGASNPNE